MAANTTVSSSFTPIVFFTPCFNKSSHQIIINSNVKTAENISHFPTCNSGGWTTDESQIVTQSIADPVIVGKRVCSYHLSHYELGSIQCVTWYTHWQPHLSHVLQTKAVRRKSERMKERESERAFERERERWMGDQRQTQTSETQSERERERE